MSMKESCRMFCNPSGQGGGSKEVMNAASFSEEINFLVSPLKTSKKKKTQKVIF